MALAAMIASAGAVGTALSLAMSLLALVLEGRGVSGQWIGINTAVAGIAAIVSTPFITPLAARFGTLKVLVAALLTVAVTLPLFYLAEAFWLWFPLRFVIHAAIGIGFVLSEFWIASLADPARRGLVMGVYATVLSIGLAIGPFVLGLVGSHGFLPFAIGSGVMVLATLPVLLARGAAPPLHGSGGTRSVVGAILAVPLATLAALTFGAVESGALTIMPVYGLRVGLEEKGAALLVTAVALGNVFLQIPLGLLADRVDRPALLYGCAATGLVGALALPWASGDFGLMAAILFVWGGVTAGLYTVGLTHLGANFTGANLAAANASFVLLYAVGMMIGPPAIGAGLDVWSPHGALWVVAGLFAVYMLVGLVLPGRKTSADGTEP